ncbi:MAG: ribose-phosphate pyrophosphokinase [Defluviitaleaceae bacterium]|nr:ribose-phosphate pyrophosphokinase [Defluviitaleaceae bacterium]
MVTGKQKRKYTPVGELKIFAANASKGLAQAIARSLGIKELGDSTVTKFADGEINMKVNETVRGSDVFIIQSVSPPHVNDYLMELLIMIDAMHRSSAGRITAVIPYYGYARQDRKAKSHDPISAKLIADLLTVAGADRVLTVDLHCPQIQGFFNIPLDHLRGVYSFAEYYKLGFGDLSDVVVVSPDLGSVTRCNNLAKLLELKSPLAIVDKRRESDTETEVEHFIGDVKGKYAIILDDVVSTGGSLVSAAEEVKKQGAKAVFACATHPVLAKDAVKLIQNSALTEIVFLDTIEVPDSKLHECVTTDLTIASDSSDTVNLRREFDPQEPKIKVLSFAKTLAEAIRRIHNGEPLGDLYKVKLPL